ncbi:MAG: hypothetical protein GSR75_00330 [Desulfurococcales archaeon]|nr:hypothetical protein [Desulfurococcales archaeon]
MTKTVSVVKAIHDSDLERVLERLGLYERLIRGELRCAICGRPLTLENLGGLYRENGEVKLVCNRIECLVEAAERVRRSRRLRA